MSDPIEAHGIISKVDEDKRLVFGWAYVSHDPKGQQQIDKSGEFIDNVDELERMAYKFVLNSRRGGQDHNRDESGPVVKSTMVESMVITPEKMDALGLPRGALPVGWWVGFHVEDDDAWKLVKNGERPSFSIHGTGVRKEVPD